MTVDRDTAVSLGESCLGCGQPIGTGTLLDFQPNVPPAGRKLGCGIETWRRFAVRYRCPMCAQFAPNTPAPERA